MKIRILFLLLASMLLAACQAPGLTKLTEKSQENKLRDTLVAYEAVVRWGPLHGAYNYLAPEVAESTEVPADLKSYRVTSYEQIGAPRQLSETEASLTVAIEYVNRDVQVVRTLMDKQIWQWQEKEETWLRSNPIPEFK